MNILFYVASMEIGGCQINAINLAKSLQNLGHNICVASGDGPLVKRLKDSGINHEFLDYDVRHISFSIILRLSRIVKKNKIDIVQAFDSIPIVEAFGSFFLHKKPVYGMITAQRMPVFYLPKSLNIAMVNPSVRDRYVSELGWKKDNLDLIVERLDCGYYSPGYEIIDSEHKIVALVSRIDIDKFPSIICFLNCVKFWLENQNDNLNIRFKIAGSGPKINTLKDLIVDMKLNDYVDLVGEQVDIPNFLRNCDLIVGMASTCQQSLSIGVPTVVIGNDGYIDLIKKENINSISYYHFNMHHVKMDSSSLHFQNILLDLLSNDKCLEEFKDFGIDYVRNNYDCMIGGKKLEKKYNEMIISEISLVKKIKLFLDFSVSLASWVKYLVFRKINLLK